MPFDPEKSGWTENLKPLEPPPDDADTPATRTVSYSAMILLCAIVLGLVVMAFPYIMTFCTGSSRTHYHTPTLEQRSDFWISGDTKAKAGYRFTAGAIAGASIAVAYLVVNAYRSK